MFLTGLYTQANTLTNGDSIPCRLSITGDPDPECRSDGYASRTATLTVSNSACSATSSKTLAVISQPAPPTIDWRWQPNGSTALSTEKTSYLKLVKE